MSASQIKKVGKYVIMDKIGRGGFSTVYKCKHEETEKIYAIKIGTTSVHREYYEKVDCLDKMSHMEEWIAYKTLGYGKGEFNNIGIPTVYETGLVRNGKKQIYPYLIMQLLGKNLSYMVTQSNFSRRHFYQYAMDMLYIIKEIHAYGIIHRDIKPSNFCTKINHGQNKEKIYILDLGFACKKISEDDKITDDFVGTPDYASSWALKGFRQSYRDDLESLGYSLLDMWLGDLPWFLTDNTSSDKGWTPNILKNMAQKREEKWDIHVKSNIIPEFLVEWINKCKNLEQKEMPDYDYFCNLIKDNSEKKFNKSDIIKKRKQCDEIFIRSEKENELKSIALSDSDNKRIKMTSEE